MNETMNEQQKENAIKEVQNAIDAMINLLEDYDIPAAEKILATAALRTLRNLESGILIS